MKKHSDMKIRMDFSYWPIVSIEDNERDKQEEHEKQSSVGNDYYWQ